MKKQTPSAVRRTREDWLRIVDDWRQSGQTKKSFCAERGLTLSRFYLFCKDSDFVQDSAPPSAGFVEMVVGPDRPVIDEAKPVSVAPTEPVATVHLPSGVRIDIRASSAFEHLSFLLATKQGSQKP